MMYRVVMNNSGMAYKDSYLGRRGEFCNAVDAKLFFDVEQGCDFAEKYGAKSNDDFMLEAVTFFICTTESDDLRLDTVEEEIETISEAIHEVECMKQEDVDLSGSIPSGFGYYVVDQNCNVMYADIAP